MVVLGIGFVARLHQDEPGLLPVGPVAAGVDHRAGVHRRQPRRARDPRPGRQRRPVRRGRRALLLVGAVPAMVFLGLVMMPFYYGVEGALGAGVPAPAVRRARRTSSTRSSFAVATVLIARREPVRAGAEHPPDARWSIIDGDPRRRRDRARLHHARRPVVGDLQRGAAVLRDRGGARAADVVALHHVGGYRRRQPRVKAFKPLGEPGLHAWRAWDRTSPTRRRRLGRDRLRARASCCQLRLLDDQLRRGPARAVGQEHVGRAPHAADRRLPEDLPAVLIIIPGLIARA